jgi:hypothetical protein
MDGPWRGTKSRTYRSGRSLVSVDSGTPHSAGQNSVLRRGAMEQVENGGEWWNASWQDAFTSAPSGRRRTRVARPDGQIAQRAGVEEDSLTLRHGPRDETSGSQRLQAVVDRPDHQALQRVGRGGEGVGQPLLYDRLRPALPADV